MEIPASMQVKTNFSSGVIAFGVIMAICYVASTVIETVLFSILLAVLLDPAVERLRRFRVPRELSVFLMVLLMIGTVYLAFLLLYSRAQDFAEELPRYAVTVRDSIQRVQRSVEQLQRQTEQVLDPTPNPVQTITVAEPSFWFEYLFRGFRTVYNLLVMVGFIPFLVFFMLTWKDHLSRSCIEAFEEADRPVVANSLKGISAMVRGFLIGNLLVGLILSAMSAILFLVLGLPFPLILGVLSGFLSLIPYLGFLLAAVGPLLVALGQFTTLAQYLVLIGCITGFHIIGLNVLFPKVVGARVNLNPVVVTLAILVWGWMWGAMGLILAIPITAAAKAVCDNVQGLNKVGRMLGE